MTRFASSGKHSEPGQRGAADSIAAPERITANAAPANHAPSALVAIHLPPIESVDCLPAEALPAYIAQIAALQARATARLTERMLAPRSSLRGVQTPRGAAPDSDLLTAGQVAERLNAKPAWVYRHKQELGGEKLHGLLRFSARRVQSYVERQRRAAA